MLLTTGSYLFTFLIAGRRLQVPGEVKKEEQLYQQIAQTVTRLQGREFNSIARVISLSIWVAKKISGEVSIFQDNKE